MRFTVLASLLGIIVAMVSIATCAAPDPNCEFGPQIAAKLNQLTLNNMLVISCNNTCDQVLCSGLLTVDMLPIKVSFCFGLSLNHCVNPSNLGYYINVPSRNVSRHGTMTHSDTDIIPGPHTPIGQSSFIITTQVEHVNATTLIYGINATVKLEEPPLVLFPYSFTVLPPQTIHVPPCSNVSTQAPPTWPPTTNSCSLAPPTSPPTTAKPISKSKTYNQPCEIGLLQCGRNEMCKVEGKIRRGGVCLCQSDAHLSPVTGYCETGVPKSTVKPPSTATPSPAGHAQTTSGPGKSKTNRTVKPPSTGTPSPAGHAQTTSNTGKSKTNLTVIIACSVVGGILFVAVVVSVIICIGRRRRNSKYRDRLQLLTDEDDDDDVATNVVI